MGFRPGLAVALIPLMVIAGAAGADRGTVPYTGSMGGVKISAVHYG